MLPVKVRLQSQPTDRPLTFTGPLDCFKQTYGKEGLRGLYRVCPPRYDVLIGRWLRLVLGHFSTYPRCCLRERDAFPGL